MGRGVPVRGTDIATIKRLRLDRPVTLLTGDNGSGKSTVLETIAAAIGFADQGGELERLGGLPAVPGTVLEGALAPVLSDTKPRNGYYLRAESFFKVAAFIDSGARLSVTGALALLAVVIRAAESGAQFVIVTHSPILLAAPMARMYELDEEGVNTAEYDDLQAVQLTRVFLEAPERYLRAIRTNSERERDAE